MHLLAIDTSTSNLSLAVSKDEQILKFRNTVLKKRMSSSIIPGIKAILEAADLTLAQIDGFVVGLGPGSFTSLRVGLSTVKGLAFAANKPIVGIPSLDILAMGVDQDRAQVCTLSDAKRDLVYACYYEKKNSTLKRKMDYVLTDVHDVLKQIDGKIVFIGDGVGLYEKDIRRVKKIIPAFADQKKARPQARFLVPLALGRFKKKKMDSVDQLVPLYLYPEHCQVRRH